MKLIVGLGNPGKKYQRTRHNAGFIAVENYLRDLFVATNLMPEAEFSYEKKLESDLFQGTLSGQQVILSRPQTSMNESGRAVKKLCDFYKIDPKKNLLIIQDDTDLPLGTYRVSFNSSSAGHKGVQSILEALDTQEFSRLRLGTETRASREDIPTEEYVLQNFSEEEQFKFLEAVRKAFNEIEHFLKT